MAAHLVDWFAVVGVGGGNRRFETYQKSRESSEKSDSAGGILNFEFLP